MIKSLITYFDYKSPYAFVAKDAIQRLGEDFAIPIEWRPYSLRIPDFLGSAEVDERGEIVVDERDAHQWRRVKYIYMDCRRLAAQRGLTLRPPRKVFSSVTAHIGMLYARRHGAFKPYHDAVFELFWKRELDLDEPAEIGKVLRRVGVDSEGFAAFAEGEGRREHDQIMISAHEKGVFGVPSFIIDGELYWGGEHIPIIREWLATGAAPLR